MLHILIDSVEDIRAMSLIAKTALVLADSWVEFAFVRRGFRFVNHTVLAKTSHCAPRTDNALVVLQFLLHASGVCSGCAFPSRHPQAPRLIGRQRPV